MTVEDTANLGLLHRQFSVRRPERVSSHSCFQLESRGHTQHEMGASIAVGRWRRLCVVGILLFTDPIDVFDHVGQPRLLRETKAAASSPTSETPQLGPPNIAAQQREARPRLQEAPRPSPLEIPAQQPEPLAASPVQGALPLAPAGIEVQLNELHLNPSAQNSPHAIVPDAKATPEIAPAAESEGSATAEANEVPSAVEGPSPAAPKDELVTITSAASVRNGPSESAGSEGLTPVLVPPQS